MNDKLQNILDIIQQSDKLDAEQKNNLLKAVKDADKELEITAFKLERTEKVKKTTAILLEETIEELEQKRKAVEAQNRELEIEASLERVRAIALSMKESADMLEVCRTISAELNLLNVKEIRNVQTAIIYQSKGTYLNYEYYVKHNKALITEVDFSIHHLQELFVNQMLNGTGELFTRTFKGKEVKDWYEHQKTTNQFADTYLETAKTLTYYWYSLGPVALGISTYEPLSDEAINLFKRFRNVFELAYRRFLDIEKALAQAREAEIELALERVRARTMGMQKSEELKEVIQLVYEQFVNLKINVDHAGFVVDYTPRGDWHFWIADERDIPSKITHPYFESVWANQFNEAKEKGIDFFATNLNFEEKNKFYNELLSYVPGLPEKSKDFYLSCPGLAATTVLFDNVSLYIENFSGIPYSDEANKILMRFGKVFQQTYTRFLDLQKAEAQARESQIEAALERVRSRSMAMHKSDELLEVITVVSQQLLHLGFKFNNVSFGINSDSYDFDFWVAAPDVDHPFKIHLPYLDSPVFNRLKKAQLNGQDFFVDSFSHAETKEWMQHLLANNDIPELTPLKRKFLLSRTGFVRSAVLLKNIFLFLINYDGIPYTDKENEIIVRFAKAFEQAYIRFLDLQNAEAQAREAQIEAAVEKIRSRSLAMHKSDDLQEVVQSVFERLNELNIEFYTAIIIIFIENSKDCIWWLVNKMNQKHSRILIKYAELPYLTNLIEAKDSGKELLSASYSGKEKKEFYNYLLEHTDFKYIAAEQKKFLLESDYATMSTALTKNIGIHITRYSEKLFSEKDTEILKRISRVFNQAYVRFLDLQKAEAQAREAEIEAALERARSRTMAMQKSNELADTASHFFEQLNSLGIKSYRFNIAIVDPESEKCQLWSTTNEGKVIPLGPMIPLTEHKVFNQIYEGWKQQQIVSVIRVEGEERINWTNYIMKFVSFNEYKPENIDLERLRKEPAIFSNFFFKQGFVVVHTLAEIDKSDLKIIQRFVKVFEQTYTRFLDLQRAEAQAQEAKIEASLERVRSKAMSMHSSEDLALTIDHFFHELKSLNIKPIRCGVGIKNGDSRTVDVIVTSATEKGEDIKLTGKLTLGGHPILDKVYEALQLQAEYFPVLRGKEISKYYQAMNPDIEFPNFTKDDVQYGYYFHYQEGGVFAWTERELFEEEIEIFRKFKSVLSLTYRRYIDLKAAEVRAFEAVRQASLDRVRAEIASMRTSEDLNHITPIIWRELKNLEVPFFRCGVYIIDEKTEMVQVYLTTPDGKSLGVLHLSFDSNEITANTVKHWQEKKVFKTHWDKEEFIEWTKSMMRLGQIQSAETYQGSTTPPESLYLHFVPFTQGMLYVGDVQPLTDEKLELVKTLAEAFSIAYARYEDFKNLEEAKNKIEITLSELKSAQAQLVHSEKMASLGELTAGIAHEIKNPLNFVNNFSEVSRELLDEMQIEIKNNNVEEVIGLVEDLKQNLEKINQHGKRADSIVKGMLLHSRGTSGEKTLTDINDLLDQYVNLAYHGMRAQNKEFNITIEKDYDDSIEKINVVPQDISRVFLNIINNACYAAYERKKSGENNFSPTLKVSTKKLNNKVEIRIGDNGNGIPKDHLDKIFQPFFTTKPSGEGTGLGLSLSYDIVTKVHNGELRVETKEDIGTEFIIILNK